MMTVSEKCPRDTLVEVLWEDTKSESGWHDATELEAAKPPLIKTVGYYHGCRKEGKKIRWIVIKHTIGDDGDADYTLIPWGCVRKMEKIC